MYIYLWVIFQHQSHSTILFIAAHSSEECPKLLVLVSGSCSPGLGFSIPTNKLVHFGLIYMENKSLEDPVWSHFPCSNGSVVPGPPPTHLPRQSTKTNLRHSSTTIITFLFILDGLSWGRMTLLGLSLSLVFRAHYKFRRVWYGAMDTLKWEGQYLYEVSRGWMMHGWPQD